MKRRALTEEEKQLWDHITRLDVPLDARPRQMANIKPNAQHAMAMTSQRRQMDERFTMMSLPPMGYDSSVPLACGVYAGIDRNTADRFRKGELAIEGAIDLHGMSREKAHIALGGFIRGHYERGSRCLLVITGKGTSFSSPSQGEDQGGGVSWKTNSHRTISGVSASHNYTNPHNHTNPHPNPPPERGREEGRHGVLRELFPQWLAEPGLKAMILAFDIAKAKHGGSGAFYILLRRKR